MLNVKKMLTKILNILAEIGVKTGWIQLATNIYYKRVGNICYVKIAGISASTTNATVATLPSGVRPTTQLAFAARSGFTLCACWINNDGTIHVNAPSSVTNLECVASFPIG